MSLTERLTDYANSDWYPMHMPGHKRRFDAADWYRQDITEIDGFDNLHHAEGVLAEAMARAARLYGVRKTYFLINGSTCGLLAGIFAVTKPGDRVLLARNCHRAVYHGVCLRGLRPAYVYPNVDTWGANGAVSPAQIEAALQKYPDTACVILTSPTYEGIVSPISDIAAVCRRYGALLLVDEAHGAHLPFAKTLPEFPESAVSQGADIVVQSVHKTLPAPTQTALLHLCSERVQKDAVENALAIFETSSPSYPLLAGIDRCLSYMEQEGQERMRDYRDRLVSFYKKAAALSGVAVRLPEPGVCRDPGKLLLSGKNLSMTGVQMYAILRNDFHIQPEMATEGYVLCMTSLCDDDEGFARLFAALTEISQRAERTKENELPHLLQKTGQKKERVLLRCAPKQAVPPCEAVWRERVVCPFAQAAGKVSAAFVTVYPPELPLLVPGEEISQELVAMLEQKKAYGLRLRGTAGEDALYVIRDECGRED